LARWNSYWEYYTPKPPKRIENGIKAKSQRGAIGETWWSKRWIKVRESLGMGARLGRGRSYARQGQVVSIDIREGLIQAKVQGTRATPYKIKIELKQLSSAEWDKVTNVMTEQAIFVAKLLAGEMPNDIESAFDQAKVPLFPRSMQDLNTDCSCPDWANPCKHIAAVYFILAEQFDADPFLIFKLRGKSKAALITELRQKRSQISAAPDADTANEIEFDLGQAVPPLSECLDVFWGTGSELPTLASNPALPEVDCSLLKRLGLAPFTLKRANLSDVLEKVYRSISQIAYARATGSEVEV